MGAGTPATGASQRPPADAARQMEQMDKGKGKGKAPPPPPPGKGNGKGNRKGHGKGKGKGPVPAPPGAKGRGKSQHKGAAWEVSTVLPLEVQAPAGASPLYRNYGGLAHAANSLWDGLSPWGPLGDSAGTTAGLQPLDHLVLDHQRLRELWMPRAAPHEASIRRTAASTLIHARESQAIEIVIVSNNLTPELVNQALTQNCEAVSVDQAHAIAQVIAPSVINYGALVESEVTRRGGSTSLTRPERMIWVLSRVPDAFERMQVLSARHSIVEEVDHATQRADKLESILERLQTSRPFRTVLQVILAVTNILAQCNFAGIRSQDLAILGSRKVGRGKVSLLTLTAENLDATHVRRQRVRFWRMFAVGRCVPEDQARMLVWAYLDDLDESPWDVLPLLQECDSEACNEQAVADIETSAANVRALSRRLRLDQVSLRALGHGATSDVWRRQLEEFMASVSTAAENLDGASQRLKDNAEHLRQLFGATQTNARVQPRIGSQDASEVLSHLRYLGKSLAEERFRLQCEHEREKARGRDMGRAGPARTWAPVDTTLATLQATRDTDLIRSLLARDARRQGGSAAGSRLNAGPERVFSRCPITGRWRATAERGIADDEATSSASQLLHGGEESLYVRCPDTGRWVPRSTVANAFHAATTEARRAEMAALAAASNAHRGPEGSYTRCPETGHWVRVFTG